MRVSWHRRFPPHQYDLRTQRAHLFSAKFSAPVMASCPRTLLKLRVVASHHSPARVKLLVCVLLAAAPIEGMLLLRVALGPEGVALCVEKGVPVCVKFVLFDPNNCGVQEKTKLDEEPLSDIIEDLISSEVTAPL